MDFVIYREWGVVVWEVDEDQHSHYAVQCEVARMMDIFGEQVKAGRLDKIRLLRYNPDSFRMNGELAKVTHKERHDRLRAAILEEPARHFSITYMFYDQSSPYPDVCLDPAFPRELRELVTL